MKLLDIQLDKPSPFKFGEGACRLWVVRQRMRHLLSTLILISLLAGCSKAHKEPLSFYSPVDWKVEYQSGVVDFYAMTVPQNKKTPNGGLLMFSRWPVPTSPEDVTSLVQTLADGFLKKAQQSTQFTLVSQKYHLQTFSGSECRGSYVVFQIVAGRGILFQTMFAMSIDGRVWNGQFTGASNNWVQALAVLKSIKKTP